MAPFRRVVRVAKPIVKARKPQSCALFSSQILRFSFPQHILCTQRVTSPLPDSAFQFPTFSITFTKPNLTTSRPTSPVTRAQKPRFCARNARKRGFRTPKAHKNLDFVLEKAENEGSRPQKRTKNQILCSKRRGLASGIVKVAFLQITAHAFKMQIPHNQIINFYQRAR